jgi:prepilin-type N-terminal cleavage/methylation domain-containing protein
MKLQQTTSTRKGFTLIEILVVIAIIAVLLGLLLTAIMPIFGKGPEAQARKELGQLGTSIATFQREMKVLKMPSRLLLKEDGNYASGIAAQDQYLVNDSVKFLKDMFPNCKFSLGVDWNGNGVIDQGYVILDGSQCLVFLLGGINGTRGFSSDLANPVPAPGRKDLLGPFYQFENTRLIGAPFPRYNDPWGTPYAYFSNYGKPDGYNRYGIPGVGGAFSDCSGLGVQPYIQSIDINNIPHYYNSDSFQLISAGADLTFGPGGLWGPNWPIPDATRDDMSNFSTGKLGAP